VKTEESRINRTTPAELVKNLPRWQSW